MIVLYLPCFSVSSKLSQKLHRKNCQIRRDGQPFPKSMQVNVIILVLFILCLLCMDIIRYTCIVYNMVKPQIFFNALSVHNIFLSSREILITLYEMFIPYSHRVLLPPFYFWLLEYITASHSIKWVSVFLWRLPEACAIS